MTGGWGGEHGEGIRVWRNKISLPASGTESLKLASWLSVSLLKIHLQLLKPRANDVFLGFPEWSLMIFLLNLKSQKSVKESLHSFHLELKLLTFCSIILFHFCWTIWKYVVDVKTFYSSTLQNISPKDKDIFLHNHNIMFMTFFSPTLSHGYFFFFFFWPHSKQHLSSLARDQNCAPCIGSVES